MSQTRQWIRRLLDRRQGCVGQQRQDSLRVRYNGYDIRDEQMEQTLVRGRSRSPVYAPPGVCATMKRHHQIERRDNPVEIDHTTLRLDRKSFAAYLLSCPSDDALNYCSYISPLRRHV